MIYLVCTKCRHALRVVPGEVGELELLVKEPELLCWECKGELEQVTAIQPHAASQLQCHDVTPVEAYAVFNGLGLPSEHDCSAQAVARLLEQHRVVKAHTSQIRGSHRCVVEMLDLEDGSRVYLGSSAHGATAYRVAKRESYVEKVNAST